MKKFILIGTILFTFLVLTIGCVQKKSNEDSGSAKNALNYQLVKHTKRDANIKQARMFPLDSPGRGQRITLFDGRTCLESEDGSFVLVKAMIKDVTKEENGLRRIELVDSVGNSYWSKEEKLRYEGDIQEYCLSNDGSSVGIYDTQGLITFYDRAGNQINLADIFVEKIWSRGRRIYGKYSRDSRYFAVNACDNVGNTFPNQSGVICFDRQGREIWRYDADEKKSGSVWVSSTNPYVVAYSRTDHNDNSFSKSTYLLDPHGKLIKRFEQITSDVLFTSNNDYALLAANRGLQLIELKTGEMIFDSYSVGSLSKQWRRAKPYSAGPLSIQRNNNLILSADVSDVKRLFCVLYHEELLVFHFDCTRAWSQPIDRAETAGRRVNPFIQFSQDAEELIVSLDSGMYRYRLAE